MRIKDDMVIFSSGRFIGANMGIIGIGAEGLYISEGADNGLWAPGMYIRPEMQQEDLLELGDAMIARWTAWRAAIAAATAEQLATTGFGDPEEEGTET